MAWDSVKDYYIEVSGDADDDNNSGTSPGAALTGGNGDLTEPVGGTWRFTPDAAFSADAVVDQVIRIKGVNNDMLCRIETVDGGLAYVEWTEGATYKIWSASGPVAENNVSGLIGGAWGDATGPDAGDSVVTWVGRIGGLTTARCGEDIGPAVNLKSGTTYEPSSAISVSGALLLILRGYGVAAGDGTKAVISANNDGGVALAAIVSNSTASANGSWLVDLRLTGGATTAAVYSSRPDGPPKIARCLIDNCAAGVRLSSTGGEIWDSQIRDCTASGVGNGTQPNILLVRCAITNNGGCGIYYSLTYSRTVTVDSCIIAENSLYGIRLRAAGGNIALVMSQSTVWANGQSGIYLHGPDPRIAVLYRFYNNLLEGNGTAPGNWYGIEVEDLWNFGALPGYDESGGHPADWIGWNHTWDNDLGDTNIPGGIPGTGNINSASALLEDPTNGDFGLGAGSPCINAGGPQTIETGDAKDTATRPDIGASQHLEGAGGGGRRGFNF